MNRMNLLDPNLPHVECRAETINRKIELNRFLQLILTEAKLILLMCFTRTVIVPHMTPEQITFRYILSLLY